jgi:hypothetical protein
VSAPALIIRLPLEGAPLLVLDCLNGWEEARLYDWLDSRPELAELAARALQLAEEAKAA